MVLRMNAYANFLLYAGLYRLAVLAIGALSICLGFRLFTLSSVRRNNADGPSASIILKFKGVEINATNILPGIYFALFGTIIIFIMVWQGPPQFNMNGIGLNGTVNTNARIAMRGGQSGAAIDSEWEKITKSNLILPEAAEPLSNIARIWDQQNRPGEAVAMARLAAKYGADKDKAAYFALFAELLLKNGDQQKALEAMQFAANRDAAYNEKLLEMQRQINQPLQE
jgi:hypothetical protein